MLAERSSVNSPPPAREGAPLEAPPEAKKKRAFSLHFPSQSGLKTAVLAGVVAVIYTEKKKKKKK